MRLSKRRAAIAFLFVILMIAAYSILADKSRAASKHASTNIQASTGKKRSNRWKPDFRLTYNAGASRLSFNFAWSIAADSGNVHAVWYDNRDGNSQIYYKRSTDEGSAWGEDTRLSEDPAAKEHPAIAISGENVYVAWHDFRNGAPNIYFKSSTDAGATWCADIRPTNNPRGAAHASVAASGSTVHVVWGDNRDGQAEIYTRHSTDNGSTWDAEQRLTDLPFDSWVPTVAVAGTNVYVAWVDTRDGNEEEYIKRSTDGGATWGPDTRLTNNAANSWAPSIAVSGNTVHFVWFDQKDSPFQPLEVEKKLDDAMSLLGLAAVDPQPAGVMVVNPEAAAKHRATEKLQQIVAAADEWVRRGGEAAKLQSILREFVEMGERGASYFEKERKLDEAMKLMGLSYIPGSQADLPKVYYLDAMMMRINDKMRQIQQAAPGWVQGGGDPQKLESILKEFETDMNLATRDWEIYYKRSTDGGISWEAETRLTNAPDISQRPSIAVSGNDLHVVWFDGRDGNTEIYYRHSADAGINWEGDLRLTDAPGESLLSTVAASRKLVHIVWFDGRDGNAEIYYKQARKKGKSNNQ